MARFPLPGDASREDLASAGASVQRLARLEADVEGVLLPALGAFLDDVRRFALRDRSGLALGSVLGLWEARIAEALEVVPDPVRVWLEPDLLASSIPDAAYDSAVAVLAAADAQGWSRRVLADQLAIALDPDEGVTSLLAAARPRHGARWSDLDVGGMKFMDRMKAEARTSVTGLDAILTQDALAAQGFTRKRWVTRKDNRVRDTHREAEGDTVPLNEPFIVGGYPLMYPGERGAPPSLVINCRCVLVGTRWRASGDFPQGRGLTP